MKATLTQRWVLVPTAMAFNRNCRLITIKRLPGPSSRLCPDCSSRTWVDHWNGSDHDGLGEETAGHTVHCMRCPWEEVNDPHPNADYQGRGAR